MLSVFSLLRLSSSSVRGGVGKGDFQSFVDLSRCAQIKEYLSELSTTAMRGQRDNTEVKGLVLLGAGPDSMHLLQHVGSAEHCREAHPTPIL